ncbi:hypothetical protein EXS71_02605, partial [Candidatus Uhrbacteria bacterium]|nr:hypothetical protein [Candidatus Uhrbacteria bacterium]
MAPPNAGQNPRQDSGDSNKALRIFRGQNQTRKTNQDQPPSSDQAAHPVRRVTGVPSIPQKSPPATPKPGLLGKFRKLAGPMAFAAGLGAMQASDRGRERTDPGQLSDPYSESMNRAGGSGSALDASAAKSYAARKTSPAEKERERQKQMMQTQQSFSGGQGEGDDQTSTGMEEQDRGAQTEPDGSESSQPEEENFQAQEQQRALMYQEQMMQQELGRGRRAQEASQRAQAAARAEQERKDKMIEQELKMMKTVFGPTIIGWLVIANAV